MIDRRTLLVGASAASALVLGGGAAWADTPPPFDEELRISPTRTTRMFAWRLAKPRGTVVFSHGHGSWPLRYSVIADLLNAHGWTVLAPLHVDSMRYPDRASFTMQASFGERIADLNATVAATPGLPVVAVGHSFGTLTALCLGGALPYLGAFRNPAVKAVLGFSTPGRIPGLIQPTAYTALGVPAMIVTGTADTVPGFVTDPADHLFVGETAPRPVYTIVVRDGGHELVADARAVARLKAPIDAFLSGYGLGNVPARRQLDKWQAPTGDRFVVKAA